MSEQITWTHVDKLVRKMLDDRMQMPCGSSDAEVAYDFVKFLDRCLEDAERDVGVKLSLIEVLHREIAQLKNKPKSKTKQRLANLEGQVKEISEKLERYGI